MPVFVHARTICIMKKGKQILAILGVIFLVLLYLTTIVAALTASPNSSGLFAASIYATIVIPVLLWAYSLFYKLLGKKKEFPSDISEETSAEKEPAPTEDSSDKSSKPTEGSPEKNSEPAETKTDEDTLQ